MDPLLEVTLTGDVLHFIQQSLKLLTASGELYGKAELEAQNIIAASIRQVQKLASNAVDLCRVYEVKLERGFTTDTPTASMLGHVCRECHDIALSMDDNLSKLFQSQHIPRRGWRSLQLALVGVWSKKEIDEQVQRLKDARLSIESTVLPQLRSSERFTMLNIENQELITALLNANGALGRDIQTQVTALSLLLSRIEVVLPAENLVPARIVSDAFIASGRKNYEVETAKIEERKRRSQVTDQILTSLTFEAIHQRYDDVPEAHRKTFNWVFQSPQNGPHALLGKQWSDFRAWLRSDDGVYWIHGKEASGKSTLMKSIVTNSKTARYLEEWAADGGTDVRAHIGKFFFWLNGTKEQRSQSGLYRSVLHELTKKETRLAPVLFPKEWATAYCNMLGYTSLIRNSVDSLESHSSYSSVTQKFSWTVPSLKHAVKNLFGQTQVPLRACLFIDGLDEYEGPESEIAELFRSVSASASIKCCISSRPSPAFQSAFPNQPSLRLEHLTYPDMQRFVAAQLQTNAAMARIAAADPEPFYDFVDEVANCANGVFLWLNLAVSCMVRDHAVEDGISEMYAQLKSTPRNLDLLYEHIVTRLDANTEESSRLTQILVAASTPMKDDWRIVSPLTLLGLSFAVEDHPTMAITTKLGGISKEEIKRRCEDMAAKLQKRCGGLLQVQKRSAKDEDLAPTATVTFIHRTVKDYLMKVQTQKILRRQTRLSQFNPDVAILKSTLLLMKAQRQPSSSDRQSYHHIDDGILYARRAEAALGPSESLCRVLDEFVDVGTRWFHLNTLSQPIFHPACSRYSLAAQCGLPHYLRHLLRADNVVARENPHRTGKRTLLSLTLLPPAGFEPFVSPQVVDALVEFGADANEAVRLLVSFLETWTRNERRYGNAGGNDGGSLDLGGWKDLIKRLLPSQGRIYQEDIEALRSVFETRPEDWIEIQCAIQASRSSIKAGGRSRGRAPEKARRKIMFIF